MTFVTCYLMSFIIILTHNQINQRKGYEIMRNKSSNLIWGLAFIIMGIFYIGNSFLGWHFSLWSWWPLFIIIPSVTSLIKNGIQFSGLIGLFIGSSFLLASQNVISGETISKLFVPVILILIGVCIIFRNSFSAKKPTTEATQKLYNSSTPEYSAVFSSNKTIFPNAPFNGTVINAVFGSVELNLRDAIITEDVVINCTSIFAGVDLFVPANVNVKVSSVPIFGGVSNKANDINDLNAPTIFVNATCMFGGIDIK